MLLTTGLPRCPGVFAPLDTPLAPKLNTLGQDEAKKQTLPFPSVQLGDGSHLEKRPESSALTSSCGWGMMPAFRYTQSSLWNLRGTPERVSHVRAPLRWLPAEFGEPHEMQSQMFPLILLGAPPP